MGPREGVDSAHGSSRSRAERSVHSRDETTVVGPAFGRARGHALLRGAYCHHPITCAGSAIMGPMSPRVAAEPRVSRRRAPAGSVLRLIDAGAGRRLERFGELLVDRPAPAVEAVAPRDPGAWASAGARFDRSDRSIVRPGEVGGGWWIREGVPRTWTVSIEGLTLELRLAAGGQVGLFPEHLPAIRALAQASLADTASGLLNLFAYTGVATLLLARLGLTVAHVDASRPAVAWARRNAELSGLSDAPVRWIVDDAESFVRRELRRERRYAGAILDPPSYGHGPRGDRWRFEDRIEGLLGAVGALVVEGGSVLVTTHTPGFEGPRLADIVRNSMSVGALEHGPLGLRAESGALLPLGAWVRAVIA